MGLDAVKVFRPEEFYSITLTDALADAIRIAEDLAVDSTK